MGTIGRIVGKVKGTVKRLKPWQHHRRRRGGPKQQAKQRVVNKINQI